MAPLQHPAARRRCGPWPGLAFPEPGGQPAPHWLLLLPLHPPALAHACPAVVLLAGFLPPAGRGASAVVSEMFVTRPLLGGASGSLEVRHAWSVHTTHFLQAPHLTPLASVAAPGRGRERQVSPKVMAGWGGGAGGGSCHLPAMSRYAELLCTRGGRQVVGPGTPSGFDSGSCRPHLCTGEGETSRLALPEVPSLHSLCPCEGSVPWASAQP